MTASPRKAPPVPPVVTDASSKPSVPPKGKKPLPPRPRVVPLEGTTSSSHPTAIAAAPKRFTIPPPVSLRSSSAPPLPPRASVKPPAVPSCASSMGAPSGGKLKDALAVLATLDKGELKELIRELERSEEIDLDADLDMNAPDTESHLHAAAPVDVGALGDTVPPPPRPSDVAPHRVRSTLVSPDELVAFLQETGARIQVPARLTMSDPLDVVFGMAHEIFFMHDALEASTFVMNAASTAVPMLGAMVRLRDERTGDWVVVAARSLPELLGQRAMPEAVGLSRALGSRTPFALTADEFGDRARLTPCPRQTLVVPIIHDSRVLGAIECFDPERGDFDALSISALRYLAERLGEFLAPRDVSLPPPAGPASGILCKLCSAGEVHDCGT